MDREERLMLIGVAVFSVAAVTAFLVAMVLVTIALAEFSFWAAVVVGLMFVGLLTVLAGVFVGMIDDRRTS